MNSQRNIVEVNDRLRSRIRNFGHAIGERFEPLSANLIFVRVPLKAVKINNSPRCAAFTVRRCKKYRISYKNSPPNIEHGWPYRKSNSTFLDFAIKLSKTFQLPSSQFNTKLFFFVFLPPTAIIYSVLTHYEI